VLSVSLPKIEMVTERGRQSWASSRWSLGSGVAVLCWRGPGRWLGGLREEKRATGHSWESADQRAVTALIKCSTKEPRNGTVVCVQASVRLGLSTPAVVHDSATARRQMSPSESVGC
jgi:hypothetical protein